MKNPLYFNTISENAGYGSHQVTKSKIKSGGIYFLFLVFMGGAVFFSTGCSTDQSTIPSFIRIDTIMVDSTCYDSTGTHSSKINFAWVYIDDYLQGVYILPAKFPVIGFGVKNIKIFGGVYEFGNLQNATRYLFYDEWETNDTLVIEDTLVLQPHVKYRTGLKIPSVQDFDAGFGSDFLPSADSEGNYIANQPGGLPGLCGYMYNGTGYTNSCIIESGTAITVPKNLPGYFVELDYKCNSAFFFSIKTSQGSRNIVGFNTHATWNKAYINITNAIDITPGTDVKLIFTLPRDTTMPTQEVFLDNIKVIF